MKAIVLAAGKGSRMHSDNPKCSTIINGKPMISWVVDSIRSSGIKDIIVVVGYKAEQIKKILGDTVTYSFQLEQLGTADAVKTTADLVEDEDLLITLGDMPFITPSTFKMAIDAYKLSCASLLVGVHTSSSIPPTLPYGRIIRCNNRVVGIVEAKDCTEEQYKIPELNVSLFITKANLLYSRLDKIENNNVQKEYYLSDIVKLYAADNLNIKTFEISNPLEVCGINSIEELEALKSKNVFN